MIYLVHQYNTILRYTIRDANQYDYDHTHTDRFIPGTFLKLVTVTYTYIVIATRNGFERVAKTLQKYLETPRIMTLKAAVLLR